MNLQKDLEYENKLKELFSDAKLILDKDGQPVDEYSKSLFERAKRLNECRRKLRKQ